MEPTQESANITIRAAKKKAPAIAGKVEGAGAKTLRQSTERQYHEETESRSPKLQEFAETNHPASPRSHGLLPSTAPGLRTVPVHVRTRGNRAAEALPPPSSSVDDKPTRGDREQERKGKARRTLGGDDDSDSDKEDKKRPAQESDDVSNSDMEEVFSEEEQGLDHRNRLLRDFARKWKTLQEHTNNASSSRLKQNGFIKSIIADKDPYFYKDAWVYAPTDFPLIISLQARLEDQELEMQDYLDEALYNYIIPPGEERPHYISPECNLEKTILDLEDTLCDRFRLRINQSVGRDLSPPEQMSVLSDVLSYVRDICWSYYDDRCPLDVYKAEVLQSIRGGLRQGASPLSNPTFQATHSFPGSLFDDYLKCLITNLMEAVIISRNTTPRDVEACSWSLLSLIPNSRRDGHLTESYKKWYLGNFVRLAKDYENARRLYREYREERKRAIAKYRRDLGRTSLRQEFIESSEGPGTVFLGLFKGGILTDVQEVSQNELFLMGWFKPESTEPYQRYQRCESLIADHTIFKVQMNRDIAGILTQEDFKRDISNELYQWFSHFDPDSVSSTPS